MTRENRKKLLMLESDFNIQMKRSSFCLGSGDIEGAERWNTEAEKTVKKMNYIINPIDIKKLIKEQEEGFNECRECGNIIDEEESFCSAYCSAANQSEY